MAAYAAVAHVISRLGPLRQGFGENTEPSLGDIEGFIADESDRVDAIIAARSLPVPLESESTAALAVRGFVADGATLRALAAKWPGASGNAQVAALRDELAARYRDELSGLRAGQHEAILVLEVGTGQAAAPTAGSFWDEGGVWHLPIYQPEILIDRGPGARRTDRL